MKKPVELHFPCCTYNLLNIRNFMSEETLCLLALAHMPGIGPVTARQLISYCGGVKQVFESDFRKLIRIPGIGNQACRMILKRDTFQKAENEMRLCQKHGAKILSYTDKAYPQRLLPLYDAPLLIYADGDMDLNPGRSVGIVGTRKMTDYGRGVTEEIIRELVPFKPLVVSGLAYGVDIAAHRAAVKYALPTIGVMASGIDVIYPLAHEKTAQQMRRNGGIVTENGFGTKPDFQRFPARNRIIAGLSDVLIVVESALRGGGLISVEFAANYHREVYAVPGRLDQVMSEGCNQLIRQNKAALFRSVADLAEELRWFGKPSEPGELFGKERGIPVYEGFSLDESQLMALLKKKGELQIDELHWQSGLAPGQVANLLLSLEFKGVVKSLPGKKYGLV